eukprot:TRINITY_DN8115_c0_g2_i2.p1 TRINITY_DN8115_c0_g2~~TRINITY_DN8115_c0_g2_i2.p1  ORF type:complete len:449 (+),score=142.91 TRINITY_DN8115_c0_g2_i2:69-1415(+)
MGDGVDESGVVRRCSPVNGRWYTKQQFQRHFRGLREWDAASSSSRIDGAAFPEAEKEERRRSPHNRRWYTKSQFVMHFGGVREWDQAVQPPASAARPPESPAERRRSPANGMWYTRDEFRRHFKGSQEWDLAATEAQVDPPAPAPPTPADSAERRPSPLNGKLYTKQQFSAYFKGTAEWEAAEQRCLLRGWYRMQKLNDKGSSDKHGDLLCDRAGRILKPAQGGGKLEKEVAAYEHLSQTGLGRFLPACHGRRDLGHSSFIELEDILHGLREPFAAMDVKIGVMTFPDGASEAKREKESRKNIPGTTGCSGFRLTGMVCGSEYSLLPPQVRARGGLTHDAFLREALTPFFADDDVADPASAWSVYNADAAEQVLVELDALVDAAAAGFGGVLRSSSVLLAREMRPGGRVVARLIDLVHFAPAEGADANFVDGLRAFREAVRERREQHR